MRISDWSSDVCSSDLDARAPTFRERASALQERLAQDLEHDAWSGVRVIRELARERHSMIDAIPVVFTSALGHRDEDERELPISWLGRTTHAITQTRSEEHTSELHSLMRISYAVFCLKKKN